MRRSTMLAALVTAVGLYGQAGPGEQDQYPDALADLPATEGLAPLFPFRVVHGTPGNVTNVQTWDGGPWRPAGTAGFVRAQGAHFVNDAGPCRFAGTNLCFTGCFPEHDKAELVAADLARFGINLVRLHYVHHASPPGRRYATPDSFIEPLQLERFDYLFQQLKQRGISVYMQLNIARKFGKEAGFENAEALPWYNNGIDTIEPRMIALQRKYVRDLLTHVNPYTQLAYKDDPAIAMLELANENSLVVNWYRGNLDRLPAPYQEFFQGLWNRWLQRKYQTTAALRQAWGCRREPLGAEQIPDGQFPAAVADSAHYPAWGLQLDDVSQGEWAIAPADDGPTADRHIARLIIRRLGKTPNIPQFFRRFEVTEGLPYTLSFKARVTPAARVSVRVSQDHDPWNVVGFRTTFEGADAWQEHTYTFLADRTDPRVRLVFADFTAGTTVELGDLSLRPGGCLGLGDDEGLDDGTVPLPKPTGPNRYHLPAILADMSDFLFDYEDAYFQQMAAVVKQEVKAPQPLAGTQLGYGFTYPMGRLDYCDAHSYWCHPAGPGGGAWTNPRFGQFWFVRNAPLVNGSPAASTLAQLAIQRPVNRPYTVSEYDHPYPNQFAAEGNPMLFALGAFQDWGAILHFAWTHNDDYDPAAISGYFDMKANPTKQVHFPACYAMFCRGDVRRGPGRYRQVLDLSEQHERTMQATAARPNQYQRSVALLGADAALALAVYAGMDLTDLPERPPVGSAEVLRVSSWNDLPATLGSPERKWIRNEFGELYWDFDAEKGGYFAVDTPATKVFTGFARGRSFEFRGMVLTPGRTRLDWATISLVKTNGAPAGPDGEWTAGRYLLAASGLMHNTGTVLKRVPPDRVSTAKGYGGIPGEAPILCEGIPATLRLRAPARRIRLFALDQAGDRAAAIPVAGTATETRLEIGPAHRTLWYEIAVE